MQEDKQEATISQLLQLHFPYILNEHLQQWDEHDDANRFYLEQNVFGILIPALQQLVEHVKHGSLNFTNPDAEMHLLPLRYIAMFLFKYNTNSNTNMQSNAFFMHINKYVQRMEPRFVKTNNSATIPQDLLQIDRNAAIRQELRDKAELIKLETEQAMVNSITTKHSHL